MTSPLFQRLYLPLLLGLVARMTSSLVGLGFHARDDYYHLLAPALAWLENPDFDWANSDMPAAGARSFLPPKILYGLLRVMQELGINAPEDMLRGLHTCLGIYSLLTVVRFYCERCHEYQEQLQTRSKCKPVINIIPERCYLQNKQQVHQTDKFGP